ncbi:MAG: hypothetical protein CEO12_146 [Parcubacteria group bacterium Gr01-1014_46]|nr:MAG: hypothetical protein CEO12_146 [Parcubacteria group bacterium Gr01-1014_46]
MRFIQVILLILIIIGLGLLSTQKYWVDPLVNFIISQESSSSTEVGGKGVKWVGNITGVKLDCIFDGVCSVTVDGKEIIVVSGGRLLPDQEAGNLIGVDSISEVEQHIGKKAEVYAERTSGGEYTLYGSSDYYIKVLK